ncbi:MAG: hypothetical protein RIR18_1346, partial [Pseudomonadota bacterium]
QRTPAASLATKKQRINKINTGLPGAYASIARQQSKNANLA